MENSSSTVEGIQYVGGTCSTCGEYHQYCGDNISTAEGIQYSGDKDLKYYEFLKNLEIFSRAYFALQSDRPHRRPQLLTMPDMVKDLGYKNLGWVKYPFGPLPDQLPNFFGYFGRICEQLMVQGPSRATAILRSIQHLLRMSSNLVGIQSEQRERLQDEGTTLK